MCHGASLEEGIRERNEEACRKPFIGLCVLYSKSGDQKGVKRNDLRNRNHSENETVADAVTGMKRPKRRYLQICKFRSIYCMYCV